MLTERRCCRDLLWLRHAGCTPTATTHQLTGATLRGNRLHRLWPDSVRTDDMLIAWDSVVENELFPFSGAFVPLSISVNKLHDALRVQHGKHAERH